MTIRHARLAALTLTLGACGGGKAPAPDTTAVAAPAPAGSALDTTRAGITGPAADSSATAIAPGAKGAATKKPDSTRAAGDYDRAIKPKFKIDEKTGKVDSIKRP